MSKSVNKLHSGSDLKDDNDFQFEVNKDWLKRKEFSTSVKTKKKIYDPDFVAANYNKLLRLE